MVHMSQKYKTPCITAINQSRRKALPDVKFGRATKTPLRFLISVQRAEAQCINWATEQGWLYWQSDHCCINAFPSRGRSAQLSLSEALKRYWLGKHSSAGRSNEEEGSRRTDLVLLCISGFKELAWRSVMYNTPEYWMCG